MTKKIKFLIILISCFNLCSFCQSIGSKTKMPTNKDSICRNEFLKTRISHTNYYSNNIIVPVIVAGDKYRMMIKSEYLHRYLTLKNSTSTNDSTLLDSLVYLNKVLRIINKKETLVFTPSIFKIFEQDKQKEVTYFIFDKPNPYTREIKRYGLNRFIEKRLVKIGDRGKNTLYRLSYETANNYGRINEFNINYLIEALFEYNLVFELGDGMNGFTKIGCD